MVFNFNQNKSVLLISLAQDPELEKSKHVIWEQVFCFLLPPPKVTEIELSFILETLRVMD